MTDEQLELFACERASLTATNAYDLIVGSTMTPPTGLAQVADALMLLDGDRRAMKTAFRLSEHGWAGTGTQLADIAKHLAARDTGAE